MRVPRPILALTAAVAGMALAGAGASSQPDHRPTPPDLSAAPAPPAAPQITVSGSGEVQRVPDYAVVFIGVQARKSTAAEASQNVGASMKHVADAVRALDIEGLQLQTSGVSLNPAYIWKNDSGEQTQTLIGYDASSMLRVRVPDPAKVGAVIDAAVDTGANRIGGISFELKNALEARQEALTMAARAARDKADTLAKALGLNITGVVTATTGEAPPRQPMMANEVAFAKAEGGMGETVEPGMVTIRADATVTFSAAPR